MTDAELLVSARQCAERASAEARKASRRAAAAVALYQSLCPHARQRFEPKQYVEPVTRCLDCDLTDYTEEGSRLLRNARWAGAVRQ